MKFNLPERNSLSILCFAILCGTLGVSIIGNARHANGVDAGLRHDSARKLAAFILKLPSRVTTNEESIVGDEAITSKIIRKKLDKESAKAMGAESDCLNYPGNEKNSELKLLKELANVRFANARLAVGRGNNTEGSILIGKAGNKKAGRLRFRISNGALFAPTRTWVTRPVETTKKTIEVNLDDATWSDLDRLGTTGKNVDKIEDRTEPSNGETLEPSDEGEAEKEGAIVNIDSGATKDRKMSIYKIFKKMAQQFDNLQDTFHEDAGCENFDRLLNTLTLENICTNHGNFTRVKFIRKKLTENEKKINKHRLSDAV